MTHTQTQGADGAGTKTNPFGSPAYDPASEIATQVMNLPWTRYSLTDPRCGMLDHDALGDRHGDVQIIARNVIEATLGPAATPGVPDSLRALSEAATAGPFSVSGVRKRYVENSCVIVDAPTCSGLFAFATADGRETLTALADAKFFVAAANHVRDAIAVHVSASEQAADDRREIEQLEHQLGVAKQERDAAFDRADAATRSAGTEAGWVVANAKEGAEQRFRRWGQIGPEWTADRTAALWFARRSDAEAFAAEDEDAWRVLPVTALAAQPAGQAGDAGADARTVLTEACKPWEHYTGEPPDDGSPLSGVFVAGMAYTERLLAKLLDVTHYEGGDGSEDFDNDATQTLRNILAGAGLWDADENCAAKPAPNSTRTGADDLAERLRREIGEIRTMAADPENKAAFCELTVVADNLEALLPAADQAGAR